MKLLHYSLLLCCLSIPFLSSCGKEDKPQLLDVDKTELQFPTGVAGRTLNIATTGEWRIEAPGLSPYIGINKGDADWYTVEPMWGVDNAKVTVTSKEGTAGNKAILRIKYDGQEKTVELKQDAVSENE